MRKAVLLIIFIAVPLAAVVYLFFIGRFIEAIATWGVSSVFIWFMLKIVERRNSRSEEILENDPD